MAERSARGVSSRMRSGRRLDRRTSSLTGRWVNDLNSTTETNSVTNTGVSSGVYTTAVSASDNPIRPSPLQVIQHQCPQPTFDFTVNWNFNYTATHYLENGEEQLKTTWLLRAEVESAADDWGATRVGSSTFYRTK
ncbi:avidin-like [Protobothrops mucrosquamatus]|uniref:avidin-like n=1 Tax=Protobothrops mucrosquamatus TaxID=103944 RepID=UPI000775DF4B|nr:avidin-like [Protobothrops mucrosquamatus]